MTSRETLRRRSTSAARLPKLRSPCPRGRSWCARDNGSGWSATKTASFNAFRQRYEELYSHLLPDVWCDDSSVTPSRHVINDTAGTLTPIVNENSVHLMDDAGKTVLSVNELAYEAVDFIAQAHDFYVRELLGELTAEESVGVIAPLVRLVC